MDAATNEGLLALLDDAMDAGWPLRRACRQLELRVTVTMVLGQLAAAAPSKQVLADYPCLEREDAFAALEYAAAVVDQRELPLPDPREPARRRNLSPAVASQLKDAGHDAVHGIDVRLTTALDPRSSTTPTPTTS